MSLPTLEIQNLTPGYDFGSQHHTTDKRKQIGRRITVSEANSAAWIQ